jgi:peptide deformylase
MKEGTVTLSYLWPAQNPELLKNLANKKINAIAMDAIPRISSLPLTFLVNPVVTSLVGPEPLADEHAISVYEGCLSVPGLRGRVRRPRRVRVRALGRDANPVDFELEGFLAAVVQHEVDHLHGSLFIDRALPGTLAFQAEYERHVPPEQRVVDGKRPPPAFP